MAGYQIKVTMEGTRPPMWRRLEIPDKITFRDFHNILQDVFGWEEMHLHEFTFQNTRVTVGEENDAEYDENELLVDEFLRAGWIRYTYDFGDDWRHKIVLEKELPDYQERYPRVVKFKRNNFEEDSGGIWGGYEDEEDAADEAVSGAAMLYDMKGVNECLKHVVCPENPEARTAKDYGIQVDQKSQEKRGREKAMELIRDIAEMFRQLSNLDKLAPIDAFMEHSDEIWPDVEEQGIWDCTRTKKLMSDILLADGTKHLLELLKYLAVPVDNIIPLIKPMAVQLSEIIKENPQYLLSIFSAADLRRYAAWFRGKGMKQLPEWNIFMGFYMWGLAEPEIELNSGNPCLHIGLPSDAECIVTYIEEQGRELDSLERAAKKKLGTDRWNADVLRLHRGAGAV